MTKRLMAQSWRTFSKCFGIVISDELLNDMWNDTELRRAWMNSCPSHFRKKKGKR